MARRAKGIKRNLYFTWNLCLHKSYKFIKAMSENQKQNDISTHVFVSFSLESSLLIVNLFCNTISSLKRVS